VSFVSIISRNPKLFCSIQQSRSKALAWSYSCIVGYDSPTVLQITVGRRLACPPRFTTCKLKSRRSFDEAIRKELIARPKILVHTLLSRCDISWSGLDYAAGAAIEIENARI
jgi:hypothetical protein